jgi:pimeloyl-ACP methyl ester carboxylesterase
MAGEGAAPKPPLWRLAGEAAAIGPLALNRFRGAIEAKGDGQDWPVLVLPGFTTDDNSTSLLRRSLDRAGFHSYGWELGFNLGLKPGLIEKLERRVEALAALEKRKVILLGWSLGGIFARALAHRIPGHVAQVITLSSPFSGSRHANRAWRLYDLLNDHTVDTIPADLEFTTKPPVPTIAAWTAKDGIVDPSSARGRPEESDRIVELDVTHFGYGGTADGVRQVVELLAANLP